MTALLPLLTLLPAILIFLVLGKTRVSFRRTRFVFTVYLVFLLLCTGAAFITAAAVETESALNKEITEIDPETSAGEFYAALSEGRVAQLPEVEKNGYWSFTYPGQELSITTAEGEHFEPSIVIERKDINDETIEVTSYTSSLKFKGNYLVSPPTVRRRGEKYLELTNGTSNVVTTYIFADDWTMQQFSADRRFPDYHWKLHSLLGEQAVVIRVPKDLQVEVGRGFHVVSLINSDS